MHPPNEFILVNLIAFKNVWSIGVCRMACYILPVPSLIDELNSIYGIYSFHTYWSCQLKIIPQHFVYNSFLDLTGYLWFLPRNATITISLVHVREHDVIFSCFFHFSLSSLIQTKSVSDVRYACANTQTHQLLVRGPSF